MTGFYSVMRNLQEDYAAYHQNYSEEALALLSKSYDFIASMEAVRSLDSLSSIDDDGINKLFFAQPANFRTVSSESSVEN